MLIPILFLALSLRLIALNQSLWLDEAVQVWASSLPLEQFFSQFLPGDFNPPLYYIFLHLWIKIFGIAELAIRLPSVILAVSSIFLMTKIMDLIQIRLKSKRLVILLLTTSPLHIYYSQEARPYMLASFGVLFSFFYFLKLLQNLSWKNSFLLAIGFLIMSFSHFLTLLTIPIFMIFIILIVKNKAFLAPSQNGRSLKRLIFPFLVLGIFYSFYLPILKQQLAATNVLTKNYPIWEQIIGGVDLKTILLLPIKFVLGRISFENRIIYGFVAFISTLLYWGVVFTSLTNKPCAKLSLKKFFVYCLLFVPPIIGFLISFKMPIFSYFRFFYLLPFFYLTIGIGIEGMKTEERRFKIGSILIIGNLIFSGIYLFNPNFHRENWKAMANWLYQENKNQKPILIISQIAKPFEYYDKYRSSIILINAPSDFNPRILPETTEIFLVSYGLPIFDPEDKIRTVLKDNGFRLVKGDSFNQVGVEKWQFLN